MNMRTITTKDAFIAWYLKVLLKAGPANPVKKDTKLEYAVKIARIHEAVPQSIRDKIGGVFAKTLGNEQIQLSTPFITFVEAAWNAAQFEMKQVLTRRRLIELMLAALPCAGLSTERDPIDDGHYLVSGSNFSAEYRVRVRVRLARIRIGTRGRPAEAPPRPRQRDIAAFPYSGPN
jgi:hypothetical protein